MGAIFRALLNGRMLSVFLYGFSSGLPLLLIGSTLKAWMKDEKVDLTLIGIYALVGMPYTLKFLWSPLLDRYQLPFLGRRRGWILISQLLLSVGFLAMASVHPSTAPALLALFSFLVAFFSASQDIAIDAYRREILTSEELGLGSSMAVNGYRIAMLVAGAGALALADHIAWPKVYIAMAVVMLLTTLITFFSPEPSTVGSPPKNLRDAVVLPFLEYFQRPHALEILAFILLFKIGDSMASDMFNPLFLDLGYTKTEVAAIAKVFGFWATILGGTLGGMAMVRLGQIRSLWIFGILQTFSTMGFSILSLASQSLSLLTAVVVFENLCTGMATSAYIGFMAALCNSRFTATQYALLSSLMGVPRVILGSSSGYLAKHLGWPGYYIFCTLMHLPGLLLLMRNKRWSSAQRNP